MSQPHYNLPYDAMALSFDLGNNGLIYNVAKYLTRDKEGEAPEKDVGKAAYILESFAGHVNRFTLPTVQASTIIDMYIKQFCDQLPEVVRYDMYHILKYTYHNQPENALKIIKEKFIA